MMPDVPTIEARMESLLRLVAEEIRPCARCKTVIAMVRHKNGKLGPYTMDGVNHFINCPNAQDFRRQKGGE